MEREALARLVQNFIIESEDKHTSVADKQDAAMLVYWAFDTIASIRDSLKTIADVARFQLK